MPPALCASARPAPWRQRRIPTRGGEGCDRWALCDGARPCETGVAAACAAQFLNESIYFARFLLLMGAGSAFTLWREAFGRAADKAVIQSLTDVFVGEAAASVASAGVALWVAEVVMLSTMLARKLDERKARILREGRREGRQEAGSMASGKAV